jgi:hypothetical protein
MQEAIPRKLSTLIWMHASVEQMDNPLLRGKPTVGGSENRV